MNINHKLFLLSKYSDISSDLSPISSPDDSPIPSPRPRPRPKVTTTKKCPFPSTITITFGGQVENQVGMQKIGKMSKYGFTKKEMKDAERKFQNEGYNTKFIKLHDLLPEKDKEEAEKAYLLIVRDGAKAFLGDDTVDELYVEQQDLDWDTQYWNDRQKKVMNKQARRNLCYADMYQGPDYENKKGTVYDFKDIPLTAKLRKKLDYYLGSKAKDLFAEGNCYFNKKSNIKWHGDAERKIVIAFRLGETMPIKYQWFRRNDPVSKVFEIDIHSGDMYVMSEKATGYDWKQTKIHTLRHAAGFVEDKQTIHSLKQKIFKKFYDTSKGSGLIANEETIDEYMPYLKNLTIEELREIKNKTLRKKDDFLEKYKKELDKKYSK